MIRLHDAITSAFPQGNQWAAEALEALSDELEPTTLVHGVIEGWLQRGAGDDLELIDTLFILTEARLGLGRTDEAPGERRWVQLTDIVAIDAVDDSPLPLQTIEIELADGLVMCLGWPETFTEVVIPVLVALAERKELDAAADVMPPELTDPAAVATDASDLESMEPSGWIEGAVASPPAAESAEPTGERPVVAALDFFNAAPPHGAPALDAPAPGDEPAAASDPWMSIETGRHDEPLAPGAFETGPFDTVPFDTVPFETVPFGAVPDESTPLESAADVEPTVARESSLADGPPPWQQPGMVWPDPLRGVLYLGGHPGHPRKRKNGSMLFSPAGLAVSGTGFQSWDMNMDWAFVDGIEIQGPDEILFGDNLKIDSTSSALIVRMADDTRMFFEIRTRRPPSLRAGLAPVLLMVENIRAYRANVGG